jgi:hypothetical protein
MYTNMETGILGMSIVLVEKSGVTDFSVTMSENQCYPTGFKRARQYQPQWALPIIDLVTDWMTKLNLSEEIDLTVQFQLCLAKPVNRM